MIITMLFSHQKHVPPLPSHISSSCIDTPMRAPNALLTPLLSTLENPHYQSDHFCKLSNYCGHFSNEKKISTVQPYKQTHTNFRVLSFIIKDDRPPSWI